MADSNVFDLSYTIKATGSSTTTSLGSSPTGAPSSITIGGTAILSARIVDNGNYHTLTVEDDYGDPYSVDIPDIVNITGYSSCKFEQATSGGTIITSTGLNREISDITICYTGSPDSGSGDENDTNPDDYRPFNFTINCTNNNGNVNNDVGFDTTGKNAGECWWVKFIRDNNKIICRYFSADDNSEYISPNDPDMGRGYIVSEIEISPTESLLWTLNYAKLEGTNEDIEYGKEYNSLNIPVINNNLTLSLKVDYDKVYYRVSTSATSGGTVTGSGTFGWPASCECNAIPNNGYEFDTDKGWQLNGEIISTSEKFNFKPDESDLYVDGELTNNILFQLVANFKKIYIPSDPEPETPTIPAGDEDKMITNNELEEISLYVFNKNGLDSSNCPTYSHISNANYNYNIISVKNDTVYENDQCVKYSDIEISGITTTITVFNQTGWGFACPVVYLGVKNNDTISYHANGRYDGAVLAWNDKTFAIPISCNASSGNWYSNSGNNKLYVKVDGSSWDANRRIEIEINGTKYSSGNEHKIEVQSTINLNTFLRNNYIIKVWVYPK